MESVFDAPPRRKVCITCCLPGLATNIRAALRCPIRRRHKKTRREIKAEREPHWTENPSKVQFRVATGSEWSCLFAHSALSTRSELWTRNSESCSTSNNFALFNEKVFIRNKKQNYSQNPASFCVLCLFFWNWNKSASVTRRRRKNERKLFWNKSKSDDRLATQIFSSFGQWKWWIDKVLNMNKLCVWKRRNIEIIANYINILDHFNRWKCGFLFNEIESNSHFSL